MSPQGLGRHRAENVSEALLLRLRQLGVDSFFANPGSEFAAIIRAFAELDPEKIPEPVTAPHEFLAVAMAYGEYLATGRPQAVMTHANVGAANALIGLIGAYRMQIPMIYIAGATATSERVSSAARDRLIHWSQESKGQGSIYGGFVKWQTELHDPGAIHDVLDRAYAIAMSEPRGPVAISISRDLLLAPLTHALPESIQVSSALAASVDLSSIPDFISRWQIAERPILITNRLGLNPQAMAQLVELSGAQNFGVFTPEDFYVSFPADHPHHLGSSPSSALSEADLVVALDTEVPWFPLERGPTASAFIVHVSSDPLEQSLELRGHRGDLFLQVTAEQFLLGLRGISLSLEKMEKRQQWLERKRSKRLECKATDDNPENFGISCVSRILAEIRERNDVIINELSLKSELLENIEPGSYFRSGSASPLGWGIGCALGLSRRQPERMIILAVGDGVLQLSPIVGGLALAAAEKLSLLVLVLDNGGYASVKKSVRQFFPSQEIDLPLTQLDGLAYDRLADLVGGKGFQVRSEEGLRVAIEEGRDFTRRSRRPVVVHVQLSKEGR